VLALGRALLDALLGAGEPLLEGGELLLSLRGVGLLL